MFGQYVKISSCASGSVLVSLLSNISQNFPEDAQQTWLIYNVGRLPWLTHSAKFAPSVALKAKMSFARCFELPSETNLHCVSFTLHTFPKACDGDAAVSRQGGINSHVRAFCRRFTHVYDTCEHDSPLRVKRHQHPGMQSRETAFRAFRTQSIHRFNTSPHCNLSAFEAYHIPCTCDTWCVCCARVRCEG